MSVADPAEYFASDIDGPWSLVTPRPEGMWEMVCASCGETDEELLHSLYMRRLPGTFGGVLCDHCITYAAEHPPSPCGCHLPLVGSGSEPSWCAGCGMPHGAERCPTQCTFGWVRCPSKDCFGPHRGGCFRCGYYGIIMCRTCGKTGWLPGTPIDGVDPCSCGTDLSVLLLPQRFVHLKACMERTQVSLHAAQVALWHDLKKFDSAPVSPAPSTTTPMTARAPHPPSTSKTAPPRRGWLGRLLLPMERGDRFNRRDPPSRRR